MRFAAPSIPSFRHIHILLIDDNVNRILVVVDKRTALSCDMK
jgi:hypothetical protein